MSEKSYIHGYSEKEQQRLLDQGDFLEQMIYKDIDFTNCRHILEIGCGVGAHLKTILERYPKAKVTGIDIDVSQVEQARENLSIHPEFKGRYNLKVADASQLELNKNDLPDGAIFCWVLEHVDNAIEILKNVRQLLKADSPIYITEVFNRGCYIQPELPNISAYWAAYNILQQQTGGDIVAGVKLGYHLKAAGFHSIDVKHISQFHDLRNVERRTIMADYLYNLLMSGSDALLKANLIDTSIVDGLHAEFIQLKERDDSIIMYPGFQASAKS